jgi:hypothetical protein
MLVGPAIVRLFIIIIIIIIIGSVEEMGQYDLIQHIVHPASTKAFRQ